MNSTFVVPPLLPEPATCNAAGQVCFKLGVDDEPQSGGRQSLARWVAHSPGIAPGAALQAIEFVGWFAAPSRTAPGRGHSMRTTAAGAAPMIEPQLG